MSSARQDPRMGTRQRAGDLGSAAARRQVEAAGRDIRDARLALGMSVAAAARRGGMSPSQHGRIERGAIRQPTHDQVGRAASAVGLDAVLRLYPSGAPVRDRGQLVTLDRFVLLLRPPLTMPREVGIRSPGDQRAWDSRILGGERPASVECEVRLHDLQAVARRVALKSRDDPDAGIVILVVARSAHNRRVLAEYRETLRLQFPLDGAGIARELRAGRVPKASGIIMA
ncbi:MAG TPA: helix-turn-helix transcriptional regulator [Candidatus Limnocylindrales bacterium]|nr:helix-turn-helix transcriptional regulator [Candidatus Limnocylindrales bacterium]